MKEKKKSAVSWILTWAGQKRIAYVWSVLLAIGNVIFKILPYFIIADIVKLFLNGEKEFEIYLAKAVLIALSFIIAELLHSLSTALSHKATFAVLANIRKSCCDKLARVPLGYVKDTPSGTFKNIMVERIDSIETTLAHIVPEFTSNLLAPIVILIYFFLTDWRLALPIIYIDQRRIIILCAVNILLHHAMLRHPGATQIRQSLVCLLIIICWKYCRLPPWYS